MSKVVLEIIAVTWVDACIEAQDSPVTAGELSDGMRLHTAGFLVRETDKSISVGLDYCEESKKWRSVMNIPKSCIVKMRKYPFRSS